MIKKIIVGKIAQVVTVEFIICSFLRKIKIKIAACFLEMQFMAKPGLCFAIGQITNKITYTSMPFYQADSPLLPSGLLGPVKMMSVVR